MVYFHKDMKVSYKRIVVFAFLWLIFGAPFFLLSPQELDLTAKELDKGGVGLWYLIILSTYVWKIRKREDISLLKRFIGGGLIGFPAVMMGIVGSVIFSREVVGFMLFELWFLVSNRFEKTSTPSQL